MRLGKEPESDLRMGPGSLEAARKLQTQNIQVTRWAAKPEDTPPGLPRDIPGLDDRALMELFRAYNAWARYLTLQLAAAQVDERHAEAHLTSVTAQAQIRARTEKNVTTMKALAATDPGVRGAEEEVLAAYSYRKLIEALHSSVDMSYSHVSREISRRSHSNDRDTRAGRYAG
jgi:hypothetical protein